MDFGNQERYDKKRKYPVNQIQMAQTDTTDYEGERQPVGYGEGNSDPHQSGYQGETSSNMNAPTGGDVQRFSGSGVKKTTNRNKRFVGHGFGQA